MSKLRSEKGFALVEVICCLCIFSIIFISMMSYDVVSINMKNTIKNTNENVYLMETLKNNIIYNISFEELENLKKENKVFINNEYLTAHKIQGYGINIFSNQPLKDKNYIQLSFLGCELKVYSLRLTLFDEKQNDIPRLHCDFYKGDYK